MKDMVLSPEKRHMSLRTPAMHAQRTGKVFASATTWGKLVRERGWLRPRKRVHPAPARRYCEDATREEEAVVVVLGLASPNHEFTWMK